MPKRTAATNPDATSAGRTKVKVTSSLGSTFMYEHKADHRLTVIKNKETNLADVVKGMVRRSIWKVDEEGGGRSEQS